MIQRSNGPVAVHLDSRDFVLLKVSVVMRATDLLLECAGPGDIEIVEELVELAKKLGVKEFELAPFRKGINERKQEFNV